MDIVRVLVAIVTILLGAYLTYASWDRFSKHSKSAERLAPVVINSGIFILGIVLLFLNSWWLLAIAGVLLVLGGLMRGPNKTLYP